MKMIVLGELRREALAGGPHAGAVQDSLLEALFWRLLRGLKPAAVSLELRQLPLRDVRQEEIAGVLQEFVGKNPVVRELARRAARKSASTHEPWS